LIFGADGTTMCIGWFEVYAVIEITTITPEQETQSYNVLVQLDGPALGNVYSTWMSRSGYDNLTGEIMSISSSRIRALFVIDGLDHGMWTVNVKDSVTSGEIDFELLPPTPVPEDIAQAVWNYILDQDTEGSAGKKVIDLKSDQDDIMGSSFDSGTDSLVKMREYISKILNRTKQQNPLLQHTITRGLMIEEGRKK